MINAASQLAVVGNRVKIIVDERMRGCYFPNFLHEFEGEVFDIDEEHIWVIGETYAMNGKEYTSGPHRYCLTDITLEVI